MKFALAPMEGIINYNFRNAYVRFFGDMDEYYTPFLTSPGLGYKEKNEVNPDNNKGQNLIPQILTNNADTFLSICEVLQEYGYRKVNFNLGCPSGTVVSKKRGSGFLGEPELLDKFLYEIYEKADMEISLKTRIGMSDLYEWEDLLKIYEKYPVSELIVHPRLRQDFYNGTPHYDAYRLAYENCRLPLCYNGDIVSPETYNEIIKMFPGTDKVMLGRGVLRHPGLADEIRTGKETDVKAIRGFHDMLYNSYKEIMSGEKPTHFKMKEIWTYLADSFPEEADLKKKIHKSKNLREYEFIVNQLFAEYC